MAVLDMPLEPFVGIEGTPSIVQWEAHLRTGVRCPRDSSPGAVAAASRAMSTQFTPLAVDYMQWRAHVTAYLGDLDRWLMGLHTEHRAVDTGAIASLQRRVAIRRLLADAFAG